MMVESKAYSMAGMKAVATVEMMADLMGHKMVAQLADKKAGTLVTLLVD